jgi:nitrite reductase/ring-hydroxylating ferredoxin subunit
MRLSSAKNINLKTFSIPTVLVGGYFYNHIRKQLSTNKLKLAESFRRLSLQEYADLQEGEMREVKYGTKDNESILVVKYDGILRALSNYCPHYGAPMHTGLLIDNIVKCPWHGASFDVVTGEADISPSINNLTTYEILSDSQGLYVNLPEKVEHSVTPKMSKRDINDKRRFIIVGGGPAGLSAAETLRQQGYTGEILIINKEKYVPYDRTVLSKFIPGSVNKLYLRTPEFLKEYDIDVRNERSLINVDNQGKSIKLEDGSEISYDKLLIASGGSPFLPNIPGIKNENVFSLRTYDDLERIKEKAKSAKSIVILGGSFIAMESASAIKKAFPQMDVTVIDRNSSPFYNSLGKEIGAALQK